jgi:hypothetical protein
MIFAREAPIAVCREGGRGGGGYRGHHGSIIPPVLGVALKDVLSQSVEGHHGSGGSQPSHPVTPLLLCPEIGNKFNIV